MAFNPNYVSPGPGVPNPSGGLKSGYTADLMGEWGGPGKTTMGANGSSGGFMDNMLGKDGWGNLALSGVSAGLQGFMGMKQLALAKDQLDFQKQAFNKNYGAQKQTTNTQLRDRQRRRYAEQPDYYVSPDEYMKQNRIK
jgi:hypothetical protein